MIQERNYKKIQMGYRNKKLKKISSTFSLLEGELYQIFRTVYTRFQI